MDHYSNDRFVRRGIMNHSNEPSQFKLHTFDGSTKLVLDWGDDDPETYTVEISDNSLKLIEEGGHTETFTKQ